MDTIKTPQKEKLSSEIIIPPSPFMKRLGYGTGISVYKLNRSPVCSRVQSPWAIKIVRSTSNKTIRNRLRNEAAILRKLNHPNIVGFRAVTNDARGEVCLALEACTSSLGDMIEARNEKELMAFPARTIAIVAYDIAKAFNYLHNTAYILHCDVKSYNILIQEDFKVCKLCDFDIALPLEPDGTVNKEHILNASSLGTAPWMAPEVALDNSPSTKSDIYSYGLVLWEMIALTVPPLCEDEYESDSSYLEESKLDSSESDNSILNSSCFKRKDWRPELPAQEYSQDYNNIFELFYCCTMKEPEYRPAADLLVKVSEEILQ
ncbi:hypothetical protein Trydic_g11255 [Trypoxylus dichotomus]